MINNKYIELLQQYRSGTISDSDRHILERAALDDPFLFDAMEGYSMHGSHADRNALAELTTPKNKEKTKVRWLNTRLIGVAASLIGLIAITFLVKSQLSSDSSEQIASAVSNEANEKNEPLAQVYGNGASASNDEMQLESSQSIEEEVEIEEKEMVAVKIGDIKNDANIEAKPSNTNVSSTAQTDVSKDVNDDLDLDIPNEIVVSSPPKMEEVETEVVAIEDVKEEAMMEVASKSTEKIITQSRSKKKAAKPEEDAISYADVDDESQYILGKVLSVDGTELIGVNVYIENTEIGAISDLEGNFKLPKYERGHQMVVHYTGFEDQKIVLGDQNFYQIVLQQKEDLSEIKITRLQVVDKFKAYPAMGMEEFEIYVKDNIKFPLEVFGATKSKKVKVSFDVDMSGNLSNFIDETKNCDECYEEAVRLLNDSGRWETKPFGSAYRTHYTFEF